jgi:hypothetical protein
MMLPSRRLLAAAPPRYVPQRLMRTHPALATAHLEGGHLALYTQAATAARLIAAFLAATAPNRPSSS